MFPSVSATVVQKFSSDLIGARLRLRAPGCAGFPPAAGFARLRLRICPAAPGIRPLRGL